MRFSELPSDLRTQDDSMPDPPSWYLESRVAPSFYNLFPFLRTQTGFLGEREEDLETQELNDLKYKNLEMNKNIPSIASRYTTIEPTSPMFKADRAEFGYGNYGDFKTTLVSLSAISAALCAYHGYKRNKKVGSSLSWGLVGLLLPVVGPLAAMSQGFAKAK